MYLDLDVEGDVVQEHYSYGPKKFNKQTDKPVIFSKTRNFLIVVEQTTDESLVSCKSETTEELPKRKQ